MLTLYRSPCCHLQAGRRGKPRHNHWYLIQQFAHSATPATSTDWIRVKNSVANLPERRRRRRWTFKSCSPQSATQLIIVCGMAEKIIQLSLACRLPTFTVTTPAPCGLVPLRSCSFTCSGTGSKRMPCDVQRLPLRNYKKQSPTKSAWKHLDISLGKHSNPGLWSACSWDPRICHSSTARSASRASTSESSSWPEAQPPCGQTSVRSSSVPLNLSWRKCMRQTKSECWTLQDIFCIALMPASPATVFKQSGVSGLHATQPSAKLDSLHHACAPPPAHLIVDVTFFHLRGLNESSHPTAGQQLQAALN